VMQYKQISLAGDTMFSEATLAVTAVTAKVL
jgi:hypothetical protein